MLIKELITIAEEKDSKGKDIQAGCTLMWTDENGDHTGKVVADPKYNGGLRVGGRSVKNIIDDSSSVKVMAEEEVVGEGLSAESEAVSEMTSKINEIGELLLQASGELRGLRRYEHYDSYLGHLVEMLSENVKQAVKNCDQIDGYLNNLDGEE